MASPPWGPGRLLQDIAVHYRHSSSGFGSYCAGEAEVIAHLSPGSK